MGPSSRTCWSYDGSGGSQQRICFRDGMVDEYGTQVREPGRVSFDTRVPGEWPPPRPASGSKELTFGMSPTSVGQLLGKPHTLAMSYYVHDRLYWGTFVDEKLTEFAVFDAPVD